MSDGEQPRPEWIFPEEKKSNKGRNWIIVGLSVLALAIIGVLLFFLLPHDREPAPTVSPSASATTPAPTSTPIPTPTATATSTPAPTQPPVPNPDLESFAGQVQPRLDDAVRGLELVTQNMDLGAQIVDSLQNDAAALSDTAAPSSIASDWTDAVSKYASTLGELRAAYDDGTDPQASLDAAGAALQQVRTLVGI
ncbi:hypothetical protein [Microbacterium abyssi]|uniref:hypothetical protein n=1 Tax=Microbacterium abyssi TaxID=2782166 RepID=UPI0018871BBD|nr:hypothetical protein [Microbacterium sp. A18JL241]